MYDVAGERAGDGMIRKKNVCFSAFKWKIRKNMRKTSENVTTQADESNNSINW